LGAAPLPVQAAASSTGTSTAKPRKRRTACIATSCRKAHQPADGLWITER
jgi:hypothetical protein